MHPVFAANTIQGWLEDTLSLSPGWALGVAAAQDQLKVAPDFQTKEAQQIEQQSSTGQ